MKREALIKSSAKLNEVQNFTFDLISLLMLANTCFANTYFILFIYFY